MADRAFVSRFSPNRTDPKVLEAIFVQRHRLAEVWLERLRDSVLTGVKHHLLAVGPRGCGKSHLVALLVGRLRKDRAICERVRFAWLPEDETTPSFWKFLLRILRSLNAEYGHEFPPPPHDQLTNVTDDRRTAVLTEYLLRKLDGRMLLVVVENLDDVMRGLKDEGQKRWRAFLQEHRVAATLATAQQLTEDLSDRDQPFFNFFQIEHLMPLSADEALSLLRKIAEHTGNTDLAAFLQSPTGRARVRAIRHITGGSHRVFIILSEFATRENLDDLVTAFEELLDELTPYYQDRLRWLPDQQREIVEFLCRQARTVPVKEIAGELFLTEQATAAQLKQLKDKGYVTAGIVGRESRYELAEPLMRLCVEVKDPRREPIRLIVEFLRVWYDQGGVIARLHCLTADADLEQRYFQAVLQAHRSGIPGPVEEALDRDLEAARATGHPEEVVRVLVELAATTDSSWRCCAIARELSDLQHPAEVLSACERAIGLEPQSTSAWLWKGWALYNLGRYVDALIACERAIELNSNCAFSYSNKGWTLYHLGKYVEALCAFDRAIELDPVSSSGWLWKGSALNQLHRYVEALTAFERAIELDPKSAFVWAWMGWPLTDLGRYEEALAACDRATELNPSFDWPWICKGRTLSTLGRHEEALAACDRATELAPNSSSAWFWKGWILRDLGRPDEALAACDCAIQLDPNFTWAWVCKGQTLNDLGRHAAALVACDRAMELDPKNPLTWVLRFGAKAGLDRIVEGMEELCSELAAQTGSAKALDSLAGAYLLQGNWSEAERVVSRRFRIPASAPNLATTEDFSEFITSVFRASTDCKVWMHRVNRLAEIAREATEELKKKKDPEQLEQTSSSMDTKTASVPPNALALLGDSLVRSLTKAAYADATADALDAWTKVWQEISERYPHLSLATRLFAVGVRYLRTKDERILLDLVQEERSILRDLFGLDEGTNEI